MTTYHVRVVTDDFNYNFGVLGYSKSRIFQTYDEAALGTTYRDYGIRTYVGSVFSTDLQELYIMAENTTNRAAPPNLPMDSTNIARYSGTDGYIYWSNYLLDSVPGSWGMEYWNTRGYYDPSLSESTFYDDVCTRFDAVNKNNIVTNNANINMVMFKYKFLDQPTKSAAVVYAYFPVFYPGNDPLASETIVV